MKLSLKLAFLSSMLMVSGILTGCSSSRTVSSESSNERPDPEWRHKTISGDWIVAEDEREVELTREEKRDITAARLLELVLQHQDDFYNPDTLSAELVEELKFYEDQITVGQFNRMNRDLDEELVTERFMLDLYQNHEEHLRKAAEASTKLFYNKNDGIDYAKPGYDLGDDPYVAEIFQRIDRMHRTSRDNQRNAEQLFRISEYIGEIEGSNLSTDAYQLFSNLYEVTRYAGLYGQMNETDLSPYWNKIVSHSMQLVEDLIDHLDGSRSKFLGDSQWVDRKFGFVDRGAKRFNGEAGKLLESGKNLDPQIQASLQTIGEKEIAKIYNQAVVEAIELVKLIDRAERRGTIVTCDVNNVCSESRLRR